MARKQNSYQRGSVVLHNGRWTLRCKELDAASKQWHFKRMVLVDPQTGKECATAKAARQAADTLMIEMNHRNNHPDPKPAELTFAEFTATTWQHYLRKRGTQISSRATYTSILEMRILPAFGARPIKSITPTDLTEFFARLSEEVATNHAFNVYGLLHTMFEVAVQHEIIPASPLRRKLHQPHREKKPKPVLSPDLIRQVILAAPPSYRVLLTTLAVTGLRIGELLALWWENIDLEAGTLTVTHTQWRHLRKAPKTRGSKRSLHLPPPLIQMLREHRDQSSFSAPTDYVFCGKDGAALSDRSLVSSVLHKALDAVGIKRDQPRAYGFHLFRHSAGTHLYHRKRDLKEVQKLLGHSRIETTANIYVHADDEITGDSTSALAEGIQIDAAWTERGFVN